MFLCNAIENRSNTAFSGQTFYLCVDHSPNLVTFTNDFALSGTTGYEGSRLIQLGGTYYALAGSNANSKVYNLSGTLLGTLSINLPTTTNNPPWPAIFPVMDEGLTKWWLLTFDNTTAFGTNLASYATLLLYKSTQTETGFEFDLWSCP